MDTEQMSHDKNHLIVVSCTSKSHKMWTALIDTRKAWNDMQNDLGGGYSYTILWDHFGYPGAPVLVLVEQVTQRETETSRQQPVLWLAATIN